jgi:hypothetical protein
VIRVVDELSAVEPGGARGVVVIESDAGGPPFHQAWAELEGQDAVALAQTWAGLRGCTPAYLNGNRTAPYPVNKDGLSLENVRGPRGEPLPQTDPLMQPARYRVDIPVARPL